MTSREISWRDSIRAVLRDAKEPLDYNVVTRLIGERELRTLTGATPERTVNKELQGMVEDGEVVRTSTGHYAFADKARLFQNAAIARIVEAEAAADDTLRLTVKAYGLYWGRNLVDWEPASGQLLGSGGAGVRHVDFAGQDGIYLLHSGNEIVYVGQSFRYSATGLYGRLRAHHTDPRKTDRWDTFSWFGFRPIDPDSGDLLQAPEKADLADVINLVEAILIEGLLPRLNMRAGEDSKEWLGSAQYFQVEDPGLIAKRLSALATIGRALR